MSISDNIKAIRTQKSIAQAEVARRLDIEPSSYHRLENRGDKLTLEQVDNIAQALGVSRLELLTWGEENEDDNSNDANVLRQRIAEVESQLADKTKLQYYQEKHIQRVNIWLGNYFRYEVWRIAVKLGMVDETTNYLAIEENYFQWGKEGKVRIINGGLLDNPFIYQMINNDVYIDDKQFAELIMAYGAPESLADFKKRTGGAE